LLLSISVVRPVHVDQPYPQVIVKKKVQYKENRSKYLSLRTISRRKERGVSKWEIKQNLGCGGDRIIGYFINIWLGTDDIDDKTSIAIKIWLWNGLTYISVHRVIVLREFCVHGVIVICDVDSFIFIPFINTRL
jgi:hypothetical protein